MAASSKQKRGRPKAEITKERISIRLSPDVLASFRSSGSGWQTRINAALREWLNRHTQTALMAMSLLLAACGHQSAEQTSAAAPATPAAPTTVTPTVFESMTGTLIPTSNRIWELSGDLYDDKGNIDPKKLTDAQWTEVKEAAARMGAGAKVLAEATGIKAAPAGVKIQSESTEGGATAAKVQKAIDADPKGFNAAAVKLVAISDELVAAAAAHDGKKTDDISGRLSEVCGGCHTKYWYPDEAPPK